jgi:hypothetical protein
MNELWIGFPRELRAERGDALEKRNEVGFRHSGPDCLNRLIDFLQRIQDAPLHFVHANDVARLGNLVNATFHQTFVGARENNAEREVRDKDRQFARVRRAAEHGGDGEI